MHLYSSQIEEQKKKKLIHTDLIMINATQVLKNDNLCTASNIFIEF